MARTAQDGPSRRNGQFARAFGGGRSLARLATLFFALASCGCAIVPRSQFDECKQLARTLRSENARLRDRVLALQSQNRDYADRAVDDARRLTTQDEAIERLEHSVQSYQEDRDRLEAAYKQLAASLRAPATTSLGRADRPDEAGVPKADSRTTAAARRKRASDDSTGRATTGTTAEANP